jgi:uncharacterized damage-inducible protein DinB
MLIEAIQQQFNAAFGVLEAAIPSFSVEKWRQGSSPFNGPARAVAHVLQCAEFYTTEDKAAFANLGKPIWQMSDAEVPSQEAMSRYLAEARAKTLAWIRSLGEPGLAGPWHNKDASCGLERLLYALRHLQHHTGEVCAYQKQAGLPPADWK